MWQQQLQDVLFLHWRVPQGVLRPLLPPILSLDEFAGQTWVSAVLLRMRVRLALLPIRTRWFDQINLRTYVRQGTNSGIWFFSVHANHHLAVATARLFTPVPYRFASIRYNYASAEKFMRAQCYSSCSLHFCVRFTVPSESGASDPLQTWLLERYRLFTWHKRRLLLGKFQHPPWTIQQVHVVSCQLQAAPFDAAIFARPPDLAHFSPGIMGEFGKFQPLRPN